MYSKVYFITQEEDEKVISDIFDNIKEKYSSEISTFSTEKIFDDTSNTKESLFLLYLDDDGIKKFFQNHLNKNINIAILPNENCPNAMRNYGVSKDIKESIEDAFNSELLSKVDLLECNGFIAFNRIVIGDMHGMNRLDYNQNSRLDKIKIFFTNLKNITFNSYTLSTSPEQSIQTAASGIRILEHSTIMNKESAIKDDLSIHDGKLNAYILAPTSLSNQLKLMTYLVP